MQVSPISRKELLPSTVELEDVYLFRTFSGLWYIFIVLVLLYSSSSVFFTSDAQSFPRNPLDIFTSPSISSRGIGNLIILP